MTGTNLSSFVDSPVPKVVSKFSTVDLSLEEDAIQFGYNEDVIGSHFRLREQPDAKLFTFMPWVRRTDFACQCRRRNVGPSDRCPACCIWSDSRA